MKLANIPFHSYANLLPLHDGPKLLDLIEDIRENGLVDPIVIYEKQILDGRRRFLACREADVNPYFKEFEGTNDEALAFAISKNLPRRHLSDAERAMVAAAIADMKQGRTKDTPNGGNTTIHDSANLLNVSERTTQRAKKILADGTEPLKKAVKNGTVSISDGAAIANEPAKAQNAAVKDVEEGKTTTAQASLRERNGQRDRADKLWPRAVLPAIIAGHELNKFRTAIMSLIEQASGFRDGPLAIHTDFVDVMEKLEAVKRMALNGMPAYRCPWCDGKGKVGAGVACRPCKSAGWVTAKIYAKSPESIGAAD